MKKFILVSDDSKQKGKKWYWSNGWGTAIAQRHHASEMTKEEADGLRDRIARVTNDNTWKVRPA